MSDPRDTLARLLAPEILDALDALISERVEDAVAGALASKAPEKLWLTLTEASELLGCSPYVVRMRARRGLLETRYQGRRLYVSTASVRNLGPVGR